MATHIAKPFASRASGLQRSYAQRWAERMTPDEAMAGAARMMAAYPEGRTGCSDEYLMALAETLCQWPFEVATKACSPVHGVPKEHKTFRPSAGQVGEWCEREAAWLGRMAERERPALPPPRIDQPSEEERAAHVNRVLGDLAARTPEQDLRKPWFHRLTITEAQQTLARYEREAQPPPLPNEPTEGVPF